MSLEFRPTIKSINIASEDLTKITLEVKNGSLNGKYDALRAFSGKTVNITIVPEYYRYSIPFDKSTNAPTQEYVVNNDGTIDFVQKEQTQLEVDDQGNIDIENRPFEVTKEIVDEFIRAAKSLEFPGNINPRSLLIRIEDGEAIEEIAEDYEMSAITVLNELEKAREYYAPYAAAWDKKRNEVIFKEAAEDVEDQDTELEEKSIENDGLSTQSNENDTKESVSETEEEQTEKLEDEEEDPY
ncbi:hypothetical protein A5886_001828 [Enterococcus sp. 8G7_MSG3316]|uniref:Uncharacterized protein n=1 Tax=Candidatus Enterococcus testudinis TaxID=1834191 RepID=A0A242A756_9ENTE|nr:hypothetical protein [Enterococcus sp. 8G7_MSG3316]OTN76749.1 hypothetical protein A5886_001828 [Enterococcus sp. 8G7_MSG3316]